MPVELLFIRIAVITAVVAAVGAGLSMVNFDHAHSLVDRLRDMPRLFWIWSVLLTAMPVILIAALYDRGRSAQRFEFLSSVAAVLTFMATSRPLIVAFAGLGPEAVLAARAPWISLALINLALGASVVAAAMICARILRQRSQDSSSDAFQSSI
ncbi:MAG: hypothetical protein KJ690_08350 [Alphaproteobacteria bacterium]|nr:hypothetical protein [Alphaproteobacteria bacterium]